MIDRDDVVPFAVQIALLLGMLGIGVALGTTLGARQLLTACLDSGALPVLPGTGVRHGQFANHACVEGVQTLQSVATTAGGGGAVLLLAGGVLDTFSDRVREVVA